ncbi:hypothetical protein [Marinobacter sp. ANT_B65]|uniref:hypothetical protein n=1 Tax=Marinobacter sp. ANT_B65 TaxID=2039467 RepID=UPI000BBF0DB8|nr:hypothetical protein [Marinobacter sp. ANT_B65]PCM45253.1 hypothetical protein CPA50_04365 [Marinobacter sp. ANT_B65]
MVTFWQRLRERDKQQHFFVSSVLVLCSAPFGLPVALAGTFAIGLGKEVWDRFYGSGFCWYDMLANTLGALAGAGVILLFGG